MNIITASSNLFSCKRCKGNFPEDNFYDRGDGKGTNKKVKNICKKCLIDRNRERREKDPQKFKSYDLMRSFGIKIDDYNKMLKEQNFSCKICLTHQSELKKQLSVDHCHKTGMIRGLLCNLCNTGLGKFKDDVEVMINAVNYLMTDLADKTKVSGLYSIKKEG